MTTATVRAGRPGRMNLWRLEWLRLVRTPRAIALGALFLVLGLIEPVLTKYQNRLLSHVGNGIRIYAPPARPPDGINAYVSEVFVLGLIVVVALAAGAFSFDTRPGLATFLRTRVASNWRLVTPRFTVHAAAAGLAYLLGSLAAWYETDLLIGSLPTGAMLAGIVCGAAYLAFAVAVAALAASVVRGTLGTVGVTLALLLALPIAGNLRVIDNWLPSALVNAPVGLASRAHHLTHYLPALGVTAATTAAILTLAVSRLRARQI